MIMIRLVLVPLLVLSPALAPAQEKPAPQAPPAVYTATVTVRHSGSNIPERFLGHLSDLRGSLTMPIDCARTAGWVVSLTAELQKDNQRPGFNLAIEDTNRLRLRSSQQHPLDRVPLKVFSTQLPLRLDAEIDLYRAADLAISIRFETIDK